MNRLPIVACAVFAAALLVVAIAPQDSEADFPQQPEPAPLAAVTPEGAASAAMPTNQPTPSTSSHDAAPADDEIARLRSVQTRRGQGVPLDALRAAQAADVWTPIEEPPSSLPVEETTSDDGRTFLAFNRLKLDSLQPGDRLSFAIPQLGREHTLLIDNVEQHQHGITTWNGRVDGMPPTYTSTITQGPEHTYGGITTPEGHFTLEVHGDKGWIVSTDKIYQQDPDEPDTLIPPSQDDAGLPPPPPGG